MDNEILKYIILTSVLFTIFILFLREFNCWYWKINERIGLQKEQNLFLKQILINYYSCLNLQS